MSVPKTVEISSALRKQKMEHDVAFDVLGQRCHLCTFCQGDFRRAWHGSPVTECHPKVLSSTSVSNASEAHGWEWYHMAGDIAGLGRTWQTISMRENQRTGESCRCRQRQHKDNKRRSRQHPKTKTKTTPEDKDKDNTRRQRQRQNQTKATLKTTPQR